MLGRWCWAAFLAGLTTIAAAPGCSVGKLVADNLAPTIDDQMKAFRQQTTVRQAREAAPALVSMVEGLVLSSPDNNDLRMRASELECTTAFLLIEADDAEWAADLYRRGAAHAVHVLRVKIEDAPGVFAGPVDRLRAEVSALTPEALRPLFWAGACLAGWARTASPGAAAADAAERARTILDRTIEVDGSFEYGMAWLLRGVADSGVRAARGGDPGRCRHDYERFLESGGGAYLPGRVLYARTCAVAGGDREAFLRVLGEVASSGAPAAPGLALADAAARQQAARLRARVDERFPAR